MAYNILLVDDSAIIRKVLTKILGLTDIVIGELVQAENGKVALEQLEKHWVDLIFLDINMPVMNGIEFIKKLRESPQHKNTPVIVVSTEGSQTRKEELASHGVAAYLRKPTTPEIISSTVKSVMSNVSHERGTP